MSAGAVLPAPFAGLAPWVEAGWAAPSSQQRAWHRYRAPRAQVEAFYAAMLPVMADAIAHLDAFDLAALPPAERTLLALAESFMEAAVPVERLRRPNPQALEIERMGFLPDYGSDVVPG